MVLLWLIIAEFGINETQAQNQEQQKPKFKFAGSISMYQDFYSYSTNDTLYRAFRPWSMTRIMGNTSISYGKFSLPFSLSYTMQKSKVDFYSPISSKFRLRDFLQNYNQLSFRPTIGNFTGFLGTQIPRYSPLTSGELPVFGAGFEWKPKKFLLAAHYGISQRPLQYDSLNNVPGAFRRTSMGGKFGYGKEESSHIYISVLKHIEDAGSATVMPISGIRPQENMVASLSPKIIIKKKFFIEGDMALSGFNGDVTDPIVNLDSMIDYVPSSVLNIFTTRFSSSLGAAAMGAVGYTAEKWSVKAIAKAFSPGYRTLNLPFFQNDRLEGLLETSLSMMKSKLNFTGSIGYRTDNIMGAKCAITNQTLGSVNLSIQLRPNWNVSGSFTNFGIRNNYTNDTLRLQNINNSFGLNSSVFFTKEKVIHSLMASFNNEAFNDYNVVSGQLADNTSQSIILSYSLSFLKLPLTLAAVGSRFKNQMWFGNLGVSMASLMGNYMLGKKKNLNLSLQTNYLYNTLPGYSADQNVNTTISSTWTVKRKLRLGVTSSLNIFRHGSVKPGIHNQENTIRLMAQYTF